MNGHDDPKPELQYTVVSADDLVVLVADVLKLMDRGYRCQGGICALHFDWENERKGYTESETMFYQAMVLDGRNT